MPLSDDKLEEAMRRVFHDELRLMLGPNTDQSKADELWEDMRFLRRTRKMMDAAANKIGWAVLGLIGAGIATLIALGTGSKLMGIGK